MLDDSYNIVILPCQVHGIHRLGHGGLWSVTDNDFCSSSNGHGMIAEAQDRRTKRKQSIHNLPCLCTVNSKARGGTGWDQLTG
jgi:hypothetical protein